MNRTRYKLLMIAWQLLVLLAGLQQAAGAATVPVGVDVSLEVNVLTHSWSTDQKEAVLQAARQELAGHLQAFFPHWRFQPVTDDHQISLALRVVDPDPDDQRLEAALQLEALYLGHLDARWIEIWLQPVDIQFRRYPNAETMARELTHLFENHFTNNRNVKLRDWLQQKVPVALTGKWLDAGSGEGSFNIVLAMDYETFKELSASIFLINAKRQTMGLLEKLEAFGVSYPAPFPPASDPPEFNGIVVQAVRRIVAGQTEAVESTVRQLNLGPVYLVEEIPLVPDFNLALTGEDIQ